jgi:hypothetical protein
MKTLGDWRSNAKQGSQRFPSGALIIGGAEGTIDFYQENQKILKI